MAEKSILISDMMERYPIVVPRLVGLWTKASGLQCWGDGSCSGSQCFITGQLIWFIIRVIEKWLWPEKCLLVSAIPQCLCCVSCTSPILGALKYLCTIVHYTEGKTETLGLLQWFHNLHYFFIFWVDCVEDENHGNLYFSVKCSDFMGAKKGMLAKLCGIL